MRSINVTIQPDTKLVPAAKAVKLCDPARTLGEILALLRAREPFQVDLSRDFQSRLAQVLRLVDQLESLKIVFDVDIEEILNRETVPPTWGFRAGSKNELKEVYEATCRAAEARENALNHPVPVVQNAFETEFQRIKDFLFARWEQHGIEGLLPEERDYILFWALDAEVSNGTLHQYLSNSSGDAASETVDALKRIGYVQIANTLEMAMEALPGGWCAERQIRNRRLSQIEDNRFETLTEDYHRAVEVMDGTRLLEYLRTAYVCGKLLDDDRNRRDDNRHHAQP